MEPNSPDSLENASADTSLPTPEQDAIDSVRDERIQPWKQHLDKIHQYNRENSVDTELFRVSEGFNDHSIAA